MSGGRSDDENNVPGVVDISNTIDEASHDIASSSSDPEDTTEFYKAMYHKSLSNVNGAVESQENGLQHIDSSCEGDVDDS